MKQEYTKHGIRLYNADNKDVMASLADESIDVILTDPPYLYLKNQKLDRPFDEMAFFNAVKRVLKKDGFIVMFGRGTSFYRWNTILADMGFLFKEEIVWDKAYCTSPLMNISRVHETISIFTKRSGTINKVKIPYLEMKGHDIDSIITDIKRLKTTFKNTKSLDAVQAFLENNITAHCDYASRHNVSTSKGMRNTDRCLSAMQYIANGMNEKSIIRTDFRRNDTCFKNGLTGNKESAGVGERAINVMPSIVFGFNEKSIIKQGRDHYNTIHPTQKPVRLLERLLALVIPQNKDRKDITILDPFGGSFSTMEAVYNMGMQGISCEIDEQYFFAGKQRIEKLPARQEKLLFDNIN
jgi:site-specific DNA-methyltransferase (adenine-specific)